MRVGPITPSKYSEGFDLEVAYYKSEGKALANRKDRIDNATSWGIYTQKKNEMHTEF